MKRRSSQHKKISGLKKHITIFSVIFLTLLVLGSAFYINNTPVSTNINAQTTSISSHCNRRSRGFLSTLFFMLGNYRCPVTKTGPDLIPANAFCKNPEGCGGDCNPNQNYGCGYGGCRFWEQCADDNGDGIYSCHDRTNGQDYWKMNPKPQNVCIDHLNTTEPSPSPITKIPTSIRPSPTTPTNMPGQQLPIAIDYSSYQTSYNQYPPTYVYAMMNRSYNQSNTTNGINGLQKINGNVTKMIMISEYNALEQILKNHSSSIKAAGVTWIGYNAERDGRTPQSELDTIFSANASINTINKMGKLTEQYGLKLMLGPVTPMWNEYFGGRTGANPQDNGAAIRAMVGDNCYLDGVAFQEQKQLSLNNIQERTDVIAQRTAYFRKNATQCPQFEAMVQIMSSWCRIDASWQACHDYYNNLKNLTKDSRINSLAIWASGEEKNDLPAFVNCLRNNQCR